MKNFINEYKHFIGEYLYPIIGNPYITDYIKIKKENIESQNFKIEKQGKYIKFLIPTQKDVIIAEFKNEVNEEMISLIVNICEKFFDIAIYSYKGSSKIRKKISDIDQKNRYNYAVQLGICKTISENTSKIEELIYILEKWSIQTYEGRKVSYAIIIDTTQEGVVDENNFYEFLQDEFSATLTDAITSAFLIDKNGNFKKYVSIIDNNDYVQGYTISPNVPFRFANLINKEVIEKRIGVFLLSNGDIIIAKNQETILIKRNGKWLNCQLSSFVNALSDFMEEYSIDNDLISQIFSTVLDISFSHTGGLIALLIDDEYLSGTNQIIDDYEQLSKSITDEELETSIKKNNEFLKKTELKKEIRKRKNKKQMIRALLNNENKKFTDIERKLRSELAALDGAFIINKNGDVVAIGTIIQNDKGSSGGGRSAAAKKLSKKGIAIKISTDGYVEVFYKTEKIYTIK